MFQKRFNVPVIIANFRWTINFVFYCSFCVASIRCKGCKDIVDHDTEYLSDDEHGYCEGADHFIP